MSCKDSNLESVGYDMVLGLTQKSVDLKTKMYLWDFGREDFKWDISEGLVYFDPLLFFNRSDDPASNTKASEILGVVNVFDLPEELNSTDATGNEKECGDYLFGLEFDSAIRATISYPTGFPKTYLPSLLNFPLDENRRGLFYNIYFSKVEVVHMKRMGEDSWELNRYTQEVPRNNSDAFWVFQCNLDLNLANATVNYDALSPQQKAVYGSDQQASYAVSELSFDFADQQDILGDITVYQGAPTINNESPTNEIDVFRRCPGLKNIIRPYWDIIKTKNLNNLTATAAPITSSNFTPMAFDFKFRSYRGSESLSDTDRNNLTSLNYLIMDQGNTLPNGLPNLTWDWLNKEEDMQDDGVIAYSNEKCFAYLAPALDPLMPIICKKPIIELEDHNKDSNTKLSLSFENCSAGNVGTISQSSGRLSCDYTSGAVVVNDSNGKSSASSTFNSLVNIRVDSHNGQRVLQCEVGIYVWLEACLDAGADQENIDGFVYAKNVATFLKINVDAAGKITASFINENGQPEEDWNRPLPSSWSTTNEWNTMVTGKDDRNIKWSTVESMINSVEDDCDQMITNALASFRVEIQNYLNTEDGSIFPGGNTFTFEDAQFSDGNDLVAKIKYQLL